jgi:general secretion pathway protein L
MALLVIQLPARQRGGSALAAPSDAELAWALSPDGVQVSRQGRAPPQRLPAADTIVAVLPPGEVAWHRITCPKAPASRLRAALGGLLEEQLLDEDDQTHLALAPGQAAGQPCWVAAVHKPWLKAQLGALAEARRPVDRLVPALAPGAAAHGQFFTAEAVPGEAGSGTGAWVALADGAQALCLPLAGSQVQHLLARWRQAGAGFHASPAAAAVAERALGQPVPIRSDAELALAAARSPWQLLQFDLAPSRRGTRALGSLLRQLRTPAWRPVRWGLAVLSLVQVVGLNAYAWQLQRDLDQRRGAMTTVLKTAHPQVRSVLDAPVQMQRETESLREAAGVPGRGDFDTLLGALAQAWPDGQPPAVQLRYEAGRLSLPAGTWTPQQVDQLRSRLQAGGWALEQADGRLTLSAGRAVPRSTSR